MISIDDFKKCDFRIAYVRQAVRVAGSEKLIELTLDLGEWGERQVIAGIGHSYEPEALISKAVVVIVNLEPRTLMGKTSHGMILASDDGLPVLLTVDRDVAPGALVR